MSDEQKDHIRQANSSIHQSPLKKLEADEDDELNLRCSIHEGSTPTKSKEAGSLMQKVI